ncbi:hypothetical protein [Photobacterium damselae]|uniref:hypothetical protein n=1 Tax=Photobacterium damselae TaxID=38293 RepID=UPI002F3E6963
MNSILCAPRMAVVLEGESPLREVCSDKSGAAKGKSSVLPREILLFVSVEINTAAMLCDEQ